MKNATSKIIESVCFLVSYIEIVRKTQNMQKENE